MKTSDMIVAFSKFIENPITKFELKKLLEREENGKTKLENYLLAYSEGREVRSIHYKLLKKVLEKGLETFIGGGKERLREALKDPHFRKGLASVVRGLAYFGVRKPFTSGAPFLIVWDVTYACNLRCKHCYANAGKPLTDELTTEEALKVVDTLEEAGVTALAFSGGEPLVRKDIFKLIDRAKDYEMHVSIATNGTLLTKENVKKLKEHGLDFIQISLDGTKDTHEVFRGIPGIYERTVEGIKNAVESGIITCISMTATKLNYKDVPKVMDLAEELGVNYFMLYNFIPTGRGTFEIDLTAEEREELLEMLWKKLNDESTKVSFLSTAPYYARIALQHKKYYLATHFYDVRLEGRLTALADFIGGCGAGRFYMALKPNGDMQPCVFFPLKLGSIKEFKNGDEFLEFWRTNEVLEKLRDKDKLEVCGDCNYKYVCGGCRARAYAYFKDYLAPDPGCIIVHSMLKKKKEELGIFEVSNDKIPLTSNCFYIRGDSDGKDRAEHR